MVFGCAAFCHPSITSDNTLESYAIDSDIQQYQLGSSQSFNEWCYIAIWVILRIWLHVPQLSNHKERVCVCVL